VLFCGHYEGFPASHLHGHRSSELASVVSTHYADWWNADQSTQFMAFVEACRAWKAAAGQLPTQVSVLVEGERGLQSDRLTSFLRMYENELRADIGLAPAARAWEHATPTINSMLRGLCCEEFAIVATDRDRLARPHGAVAADPTRILARILGDLHEPSGRVAIPGFYAGVDALLEPLRDRPSDRTSDSDDPPPALDSGLPEDDRSDVDAETMSAAPTCEIDSVSGSRSDDGPRLAIHPGALAKLSFHLVCPQDPDAVRRAFRDFARARVPVGSRIEFRPGISTPPVRFPTSNPAFRKVRDALTAEWERRAVFACGDAAPAIHALRHALGMEVIVTSFPEPRDSCRSARKVPEPSNYRGGIRSWARILDALAQ
jgi:acetylornithine deacetylase/succinyl-diaminopimelate desuccinylase-like protein